MLWTFPVNTLSSDHYLPTPFLFNEPPQAFVFPLQLPHQEQDTVPPQEQLIPHSNSDSGSENSKPNHAISSSGSDDRESSDNNSKPNHANSCCDRKPNSKNRKRKRMLSNRESATRSRMRKRRYLEDLMGHVNRLGVENRVLANRVLLVSQRCVVLRSNNERIRAESSELRRRLWDIQLLSNSSAWACSDVGQTPNDH